MSGDATLRLNGVDLVADLSGALWWPEASVAVIFAVMAAVLLVRPQGLFGIR